MATTWGSNSWGDNSWASNQNNIDVNGIGASFNLGQAQYVPIDGWSRSAWGFESWGVEYQNQNIDVTGFGLSTNQGEETINAEVNEGWGRLTWNEEAWGIGGDVIATGQELSTNLGTPTINAEVNIGWGSDTWGYETWGISGLTVDLTGIGLTATIDDVTIKADASTGELTGEEMTSVVGDALGSATVDAPVTGQPMTATLQYQEAIVDPTGQELTANDGTADLDANTIAEVSATSASSWGYKSAWGFGVYGNQQITTLAMAMQENDVDPAPDAEATGQAMAMFQGEETVTGDANVDVLNPSEGGNGFSVNGDAQLSTAEKQFGTASLLVDGTGDYVNASGTVDGLDGGAFTVEFWWYASDATTQTGILWDGRNASGDGYSIGIDNGNLILYEDGAQLSSSSGLFSNNTWMHLAFARDASNNGALWSRGTRRNAIGGGLVNNNNSNRTFIGADLNGANAVSAYIDEYRQSDIARYNPVTDASITVPTSEFSIDANTVNLLHFDGTNGSTTISNALPPSMAMTMADGTAELDANTIAAVTGQELTAQENDVEEVTGNANVLLSGNALTMAEGSLRTLIWNQVNTGTAPVVPPGWQEVDTAA
jgi:hypothetical protein